ncbi:MAG: hypothetical protein ACRC2U_07780 [Aeromonas sp.]
MEFVKVQMLKSKAGSPDGIQVVFYTEGETYDVPLALAESFVTEGVAEQVAEGKAVREAPANKAVAKAPANKAK